MICSFCGRLPSIAVSRNHKVGVCKACATTDGELDNFINAAVKACGETPGSGLPVSTTQFSGTDQLHRRQARRGRGSSAAELQATAARQRELTRRRMAPTVVEMSLGHVLRDGELVRHTRRVTRGRLRLSDEARRYVEAVTAGACGQ